MFIEELEKLEKKTKNGHGGKREGAGQKQGTIQEKTKKKLEALKQFKIRGRKNIDKLFNAQLSLALGNTFMYKVNKTESKYGKTTKRKHTIVTNQNEIKKVLDETDGKAGLVDEDYYYLATKAPDNKAIDSLLDRILGKAPQGIDLTTKGEKVNMVFYLPEKK